MAKTINNNGNGNVSNEIMTSKKLVNQAEKVYWSEDSSDKTQALKLASQFESDMTQALLTGSTLVNAGLKQFLATGNFSRLWLQLNLIANAESGKRGYSILEKTLVGLTGGLVPYRNGYAYARHESIISISCNKSLENGKPKLAYEYNLKRGYSRRDLCKVYEKMLAILGKLKIENFCQYFDNLPILRQERDSIASDTCEQVRKYLEKKIKETSDKACIAKLQAAIQALA